MADPTCERCGSTNPKVRKEIQTGEGQVARECDNDVFHGLLTVCARCDGKAAERGTVRKHGIPVPCDNDIFHGKPVRGHHYGGDQNPFEAIKIIEYYELNFSLGSVIKYVLRHGKKAGESAVLDLRKAAWYCEREAQRLEKSK